VREIRARIDAVFRISIRTVRETIPKCIGYFLVRMSQEKLSSELHMRINENDSILDALGEPKHIQERRNTLQETIEILKKSLKVLQRDPDITAASSIDDGELAEELRRDALERKKNEMNAKQGGAPPNRGPGPGPGPGPNQGRPMAAGQNQMPPNQNMRPAGQGPPPN
jgi:hypothetical protein